MTDIRKWEDNEHWVEIDLDLCVGVADCFEICPVECFELLDGKVSAENIGECIDCLACEGICPVEAILKHSAWD
jgi:NAD-dependent dihydropyrimidine dehydrogenase PreA subunit